MQYLLGWCVGSDNPNSDHVFMVERRVKRRPITGGPACDYHETIIFKTHAEAMREAVKLAKRRTPEADWKTFISGARYETRNPDHAKGLPAWEDKHGERQYVEA